MSEQPKLDTTVPHEARMYDYWLGGKDNYEPDRQLGDMIRKHIPTISAMARANRDFMTRAVRYLVQDAGVRQFLDIGTGIPTQPNVHQVAQDVDPSVRVLYTDKDPLVLAHARALMASTPEGRTAFMLGDFREPDGILGSQELAETLDLQRPVALLLVAILMYFDPADGDDPYPVVKQLVDALPSGSYVALTHPTGDFDPPAMEAVSATARGAGMTIVPRTKEQVADFLEGLDLVEPGVVPVLGWRPDGDAVPEEELKSAYYWAAVARKP